MFRFQVVPFSGPIQCSAFKWPLSVVPFSLDILQQIRKISFQWPYSAVPSSVPLSSSPFQRSRSRSPVPAFHFPAVTLQYFTFQWPLSKGSFPEVITSSSFHPKFSLSSDTRINGNTFTILIKIEKDYRRAGTKVTVFLKWWCAAAGKLLRRSR